MKVEFEHNYQHKVMTQSFTEATTLSNEADVMEWRKQWMSSLSSWHSPYKAVIDCRNLTVASSDLEEPLKRMVTFFKGFFLKKVIGHGLDPEKNHQLLPFEIFAEEEEALSAVGLNKQRVTGQAGDFRSAIQIQNHFQQHSVEITFSDPVSLDSKEKLEQLRSKLTNNLMQWHSGWNLIIDCSNMGCAIDIHEAFEQMVVYFRGLFLKEVVGYSPSTSKESYPFPVFRSRHRAVGQLEAEGAFSGDEADCVSRKT